MHLLIRMSFTRRAGQKDKTRSSSLERTSLGERETHSPIWGALEERDHVHDFVWGKEPSNLLNKVGL